MRLHEAIEKAGESGKIRRGCWSKKVSSYIIPEDNYVNMETEDKAPCRQTFSIGNLTANDWEVVKDMPKVEVGDTCSYGDGIESMEIKIIHINPNGSCVTIDGAGQSATIHSNHLTLIRKGPKVHTFEGVKLGVVNQVTGYIGLNLKPNFNIPHEDIMKTHTVTFKPEPTTREGGKDE